MLVDARTALSETVNLLQGQICLFRLSEFAVLWALGSVIVSFDFFGLFFFSGT